MKKIWIATIALIFMSNARADISDNITQGAKAYDWENCITAKTSDCINSCAISENLNCKDNCDDMAKDKCLSEGISPP